MDKETEQQQRFIDQFLQLAEGASKKFKDKWDHNISFVNPSHEKIIPSFNDGAIHLLSTEERKKFELIRHKYFSKTL
ncbi:MAG: hypothetical protein M3R50_02640 [Bacteroidota bacterium]|nr:hypothetical protein [Bacteroidota bacterium]